MTFHYVGELGDHPSQEEVPSLLESLTKYQQGSGPILSSRLHSKTKPILFSFLFLSLASVPKVPPLHGSLLLKVALYAWASQVVPESRTHLQMQGTKETWVQSLGQQDLLEEGMATHSSILAWRILWTEEPGGLQPMGSQRVRYN